jgi:hypothetical protein
MPPSSRRPAKRRRPSKRGPRPVAIDSVTADIEEELRLQRQQQQEQRMKLSPQEAQEPPKDLGGYRWDKERKAYFPAASFEPHIDADTAKVVGNEARARMRQFPFRSVGEIVFPTAKQRSSTSYLVTPLEACSSPRERRRLLSLWGTRALLQSSRTTPAAKFVERHVLGRVRPLELITFLHAPYDETLTVVNNDLEGLLHRPPWTRTFDVWEYSNLEQPQMISTGNKYAVTRDTYRSIPVYPELLQSAFACRYRSLPSDHLKPRKIVFGFIRHDTERIDVVRTCRVDYTSPSSQEISGGGYNTSLINDFCYMDPSTILEVPLHQSRRTPCLLKTVMRDRIYSEEVTSSKWMNSKSDALCVEADYDGGLACVGYRNGQLVVTDLNVQIQAGTGKMNEENSPWEPHGSIHSLVSIGNKQMLSRGSTGACRLWDLRKLSSDSSFRTESAIVTEYCFPADQVAQRLTRKCRGIATDPSHSSVFSPMVSEDGEIPCLGIWSLHTGEYVGSKPLAPHPDTDAGDVIAPTSNWGVSWVELCARATTAWEYRRKDEYDDENDSDNKDDDDGDDVRARRRHGAFGLWYKTGMSMAGPSLPQTAGNIHHVTFEGRAATTPGVSSSFI